MLDGLLDRFDALELAGPIEWTRSNKHTGVRHMPVRLCRGEETDFNAQLSALSSQPDSMRTFRIRRLIR